MNAVHGIGQLRQRRNLGTILKHAVVPVALATTALLGVFLPMGISESGEYTTVLTASTITPQSSAAMAYYKASTPIAAVNKDSTAIGQSDGSDVVIIGDSITVHSKAALLQKLPKALIDAKSGTYIKNDSPEFGNSGLSRLRDIKADDQLRDVLVFAMGTNRDFNSDQQLAGYIDELVNLAGSDTKIILMTFYSPETSPYPRWSSSIKTIASKYDNVTIADWEKAVSDTGDPDAFFLKEEGIDVHPNDKGRELFASIVQTAVNDVTEMKVMMEAGSAGPITLLSGKTVTEGVAVDIPASVPQTGITANSTGYRRNWAYDQGKIYRQWIAKGSVVTHSVATIDDYYLIATTLKFGTTGDAVVVVLEDGTQFKAIIADSKGANPAYSPHAGESGSEWGHYMWTPSGMKNDIIEWEKAGSNLNKGLREAGFYGKKVVQIINYGSWLKG